MELADDVARAVENRLVAYEWGCPVGDGAVNEARADLRAALSRVLDTTAAAQREAASLYLEVQRLIRIAVHAAAAKEAAIAERDEAEGRTIKCRDDYIRDLELTNGEIAVELGRQIDEAEARADAECLAKEAAIAERDEARAFAEQRCAEMRRENVWPPAVPWEPQSVPKEGE